MDVINSKLSKLSVGVDVISILICYVIQLILISICASIDSAIPWIILAVLSFVICIISKIKIGESIMSLIIWLMLGIIVAPFCLSRMIRRNWLWPMISRNNVLSKLTEKELTQILSEMSYIRDWFENLSADEQSDVMSNKIKPGGKEEKWIYGCQYYIEAVDFCNTIEALIKQ